LRSISSRLICSCPDRPPGSSGWPRRGRYNASQGRASGVRGGPRILPRPAKKDPRHARARLRTLQKGLLRTTSGIDGASTASSEPPVFLGGNSGMGHCARRDHFARSGAA
jgi:hypothetical protein